MARPLPESLRQPIESEADAKAWIANLIDADLHFHLDDDPEDIYETESGAPTFSGDDVDLVRDQVAACFEHLDDPHEVMITTHIDKYGENSVFHESNSG